MNLIQTSSLTGFGDWCPTLPERLIFHSSLHFPFFSFKTPHPSLCPPPSAFPQTALMTFHNVPQIPHNPQPTITYNSEEKVCTSSDFHQLWQKTTLLSKVPWLSFPSPINGVIHQLRHVVALLSQMFSLSLHPIDSGNIELNMSIYLGPQSIKPYLRQCREWSTAASAEYRDRPPVWTDDLFIWSR